jgi:Serine/threonine protein phosphatase
MDVTFSFAALSDVGLVRSGNQDSGYAGPRLLVLADGMGGPAGGDIASSVAVACLAPLDTDPVPSDQMMERLRGALQEAHDELVARTVVEPSLKGLGTTCIAVLRSGNKLAMVHIGDSRAYLLREGFLTQVTTDHSFVQYLVDTGQITPQEAERHPKRSVILRVLSDLDGTVNADETVREAVVGDRWLLCSDGLSGVVSAETISEVLSTVPNLDDAASELVNLALLAGAPDNVTCVLADVVASDESENTTPVIVGAAATDRLAATRGGRGAAGKAAALTAKPPSPEVDEPAPEEQRPKRSLAKRLTIAFVSLFVIGIAIAGWFGYQWSQTQFYAVDKDGSVVAYQGVSGWPFARQLSIEDIAVDDLTKNDQLRLRDPVPFSDRPSLDQYLEGLQTSVEENQVVKDPPSTGSSKSSRNNSRSQSGD